jgi:hypothetical protein
MNINIIKYVIHLRYLFEIGQNQYKRSTESYPVIYGIQILKLLQLQYIFVNT